MKVILLILSILMIFSCVCSDNEFHCDGKKNNQEIVEAQFLLQKEVNNGKLYHIKGKDQIINVVVLHGSWMNMGIAMGKLLKDELKYNMAHLFDNYRTKAHKYADKYIPAFIVDFILYFAEPLANLLLNLTWIVTRDYTPPRYFEEMKGISIGSGIDYMDIVRVSQFPELIKAACSLVGVWDKATGNEGELLFLRALDWATDSCVTKNPVVSIYHPDEAKSIPFANFAYAGLVGSFTAMNANGLFIAEKYWMPKANENVITSRVGKPWHCVIRDVAQFTDTMPDAIEMLRGTPRTCAIHLGIASKKDHEFRALHYSFNRLNVYNDKNFPQQDDVHPYLENVAYWDRHPQPSHDRCMGEVLKAQHGKINAEYLYREVAPLHKTGNAQLLIIDVTRMQLYFAYSTHTPLRNAYDRYFFHVDINSMFAL